MKVTLNLISNIFIAGLIGILPYLSMIRGAVKGGTQDAWALMPVMILPFIIYIISAFGLEMADQGYKAVNKKNKASVFYFIMLISTMLVPYILAMLVPYINASYIREISFVVFIVLFIYTFYLFYKGKKLSVLFLLPLLIFEIYKFLR